MRGGLDDLERGDQGLAGGRRLGVLPQVAAGVERLVDLGGGGRVLGQRLADLRALGIGGPALGVVDVVEQDAVALRSEGDRQVDRGLADGALAQQRVDLGVEAEVARERRLERQRLGEQLDRRGRASGRERLQARLARAHLGVLGVAAAQRRQPGAGLVGLALGQQAVDVEQLLRRGGWLCGHVRRDRLWVDRRHRWFDGVGLGRRDDGVVDGAGALDLGRADGGRARVAEEPPQGHGAADQGDHADGDRGAKPRAAVQRVGVHHLDEGQRSRAQGVGQRAVDRHQAGEVGAAGGDDVGQRVVLLVLAVLVAAAAEGLEVALERHADGASVGEALLLLLGEQAEDHPGELLRDLGRQRGRLGADLHADERDRVVAVEGQAAGDDLVEQHAGGVEVGAGVDLQAEGLLGAHVLRGAEHHAGAGHLLERTVAADDLGDAEVDQLEHLAALVVAGDEDVLRLQVAVDHALAVGVLEAAEHLQDEADGPLGRRGSVEDVLQLGALEQLHDEVLHALVGGAELGDLDAVGVVEAGGALGLAVEAFDELGVATKVGVEDLDGDVAAQQDVAAAVHRSHAALADERVEAIGAREDGADHPGQILFDLLLVAHGVTSRLEGEGIRTCPIFSGALWCARSLRRGKPGSTRAPRGSR